MEDRLLILIEPSYSQLTVTDIYKFLGTHPKNVFLMENVFNWNQICKFNPDIIYIVVCNVPNVNFEPYLNSLKSLNKPLCLLADDFFYTREIISSPFINLFDSVILSVNQEKIRTQLQTSLPSIHITNFKHCCIDTELFQDYHLEKKWDILIFGTMECKQKRDNGLLSLPLNDADVAYFNDWMQKTGNLELPDEINFYILRTKLRDLFLKHQSKYKICYLEIQNGEWGANIKGADLSKLINQSHLSIACPSRSDKLMRKFVEISMSGCTILGNAPTDYKDFFRENIVDVNEYMTDEQILEKVDSALADKKTLNDRASVFAEKIRSICNFENGFSDIKKINREIIGRRVK